MRKSKCQRCKEEYVPDIYGQLKCQRCLHDLNLTGENRPFEYCEHINAYKISAAFHVKNRLKMLNDLRVMQARYDVLETRNFRLCELIDELKNQSGLSEWLCQQNEELQDKLLNFDKRKGGE